MKLNKLLILIAISIIMTLVTVILIRENQHLAQIENYLDREIRKEETRLEVYEEFTNNYNDLQASYDGLCIDYQELKEKSDIVYEEFICTGYSGYDGEQGTNGITATGFKTDCGLPIVAVDPKVIPLYSIVEIEGLGGFVALDVGSAIRGNRIDILFDSREEAIEFGKQELMVRVIR